MFEAYVPTRTIDSLEVRVRSSLPGPIVLRLDDSEITIGKPNISYREKHFYRHTFKNLGPGCAFQLEAAHLESGTKTTMGTATLPPPPGPTKLRIGIMSDLHMPLQSGSIDQYRYGTKRLVGLARELTIKYLQRLNQLKADIIVLPGDLVEPCSHESIAMLRDILSSSSAPCFPIIGNHEPWSTGGESLFYKGFDLPAHGYYSIQKNGVKLIMLNTPDPSALSSGSQQFQWLNDQLQNTIPDDDIVIFSHFSLLLHPCVAGPRNDGYQLLNNHRKILQLMSRFQNVRLFVAGHKNVPSIVVQNSVIHTLSPQLIQTPCGYDMIQLFEGGAARTTFEIEEQHYCEVARAAYEHDWAMRYGDEKGRSFCMAYPG